MSSVVRQLLGEAHITQEIARMEKLREKPYTPEERRTIMGLDAIAERLARHVAEVINAEAPKFPVEPLRYNAQWTLEELIKKLEAMV